MTAPQHPSVTVVIPTIRLDPWLDAAVESILNQQQVQLQLIVIQDGAAPGPTPSWFADERVTLLENSTRLGVGRTLQRAMEHATGDFVARLDADDISMFGRLSIQAQYLLNNSDTVAVSAGTEVIDGSGTVTGRFSFKPGPDVRADLLLQNVIVQSAVMFRLEDFRAVGGYEPLKQMEDYHLWLKLAQRGKVALLDATLAQYRVHGSQLSLGAKPHGDHIMKVLIERRRLAQQLGARRIVASSKNIIWIAMQYLRYYILTPLKRRTRRNSA